MITPLSPASPLKTLIRQRLLADAALTAIVSTRVYASKPPSNPTKPFIRIETPQGEPQWYDGSDGGSDVNGVVTSYTGATSTMPDPEKGAADINAHVIRILSGIDAVLEDQVSVSFVPTIDQVLRDPEEADVWSGFVRYVATAS